MKGSVSTKATEPVLAREAIIDIKRSTDSHTDVVPQAALATFIAEGHLARHIRRMRPIYAQRRRALEQGAQEHWADFLQVLPGNAGLHLSARIVDAALSQTVFELARKHLPGALPLSAYSMGTTRPHGLCIGYCGVEVDQVASAVRALGAAMRALRRRRSEK